MLDTSARLLKLLSLLQSRADWSGPELAAATRDRQRLRYRDHVGTSTRRVVERLRRALHGQETHSDEPGDDRG